MAREVPHRSFAKATAKEKLLDDAGFVAIEAAAAREVEEAVAFALASPEPPLEEIELDIYAGEFIE